MIFLFTITIYIIIAIILRINTLCDIIVKDTRRNVVIFFEKLED